MVGYLRQLDLTDFKSYAGHCTIGPFDPFTSIIGPNGSGKSNLMDAISFVLGVSSGKLRSSNLGELVHRGSGGASTAGRRGKKEAVQKATVSAVYVKEDNQELLFTRTVTLAGVSEYFLNNTLITHAEYDKMLQSENILVRARNFLVFQGDVEAIAGKTPKELTRLLEQISGSDSLREEYDLLKEEHERAVESSTFAFNKRRGLSAEIKAVQEQKEEVVRFEELLAMRQDLQTDFALHQLKAVEEDAKRLADSIDTQQAGLEMADTAHSKAEQRYKEARKEHAKVMKDILATEKRLKKANDEQERGNPETLAAREKLKAVDKRIQDGLTAHQRLLVEQQRLAAEQQTLEQEIAALNSARSAKEADLQSQMAAKIPPKYRAEYDELKVQVDEQSAKERLKLDTLERKIAPQQVQRKQVEAKLGELTLRREQLEADLKIVTARLLDIERATKDNQLTLAGIEERAKSKVMRRRKIAEDEAELTDRLHVVAEQLVQVKSAEEETERQRRLRDSIDTLKRIFPGVHGALMESCQPTAKRYEEPLLAVMAAMSDAVIVEHRQVAVECVKYLREQRMAPLTFIPGDSVELSSLERIRQELPDGCRLAADLLRPTATNSTTSTPTATATIQRAIQFVCGTAVVCESLVQCRSVMATTNSALHKAVSLEGHIVHSNGHLSGGRHLRSKASRWEDKQVREWKAERDSLMGRLQELNREARKLDAEERLSDERVDVEERLRYLDSELQSNTRKQQGLQEQLEHILGEIHAKQDDLDDIDAQCSKTVKEQDAVKARLRAISDSLFAAFTKRTGISYHEESVPEWSRQVADCRAQFALIIGKMRSQASVVAGQLAKCEQDLQAAVSHLKEAEVLRAELLALIGSLESQESTHQKTLDDITATLLALRSKLDQVDTDHHRKAVSEAAASRQALGKELAMAELDIERALRERDQILRRCGVEQIYVPLLKGSLSDSDFQNVVVDYGKASKKANKAQLAQKLADIQQELDQLAPNLRALDKLEGAEVRLKTAMESFERQRADAKRARDAFTRVKQLRYDLFAPCFRHVSEAIDTIYKALAGDTGTAYLSLEDSEEPYLEGIRFHAMPPGKRFLDMEALSGGERTMAALSLLFALHSFLPAPFFILDEVDAALDNANVQRLAQYLRRLATSRACQLLVISLKPGLYEQADALVGVYRDGSQCSRPLTLRLTDYDGDEGLDGGHDENAVPANAPPTPHELQ